MLCIWTFLCGLWIDLILESWFHHISFYIISLLPFRSRRWRHLRTHRYFCIFAKLVLLIVKVWSLEKALFFQVGWWVEISEPYRWYKIVIHLSLWFSSHRYREPFLFFPTHQIRWHFLLILCRVWFTELSLKMQVWWSWLPWLCISYS